MEGSEHPFIEGVVETDLVRHVVVEEVEDIKVVSALGGRGHPQKERRGEVFNDALIRGRPGSVGLIDRDVVEGVRRKALQGRAAAKVSGLVAKTKR